MDVQAGGAGLQQAKLEIFYGLDLLMIGQIMGVLLL